jgi:mono/diheme cytochrome c family protein
MMKRLSGLFGVLILAAGAAAKSPIEKAPIEKISKKNPLDGNSKARLAGAKLFDRECAACHGAEAQGIGKAPALKRSDVTNAPAGALFWVVENGSLRKGMPSFAHLPAPQRWQIVTFLRSLTENPR